MANCPTCGERELTREERDSLNELFWSETKQTEFQKQRDLRIAERVRDAVIKYAVIQLGHTVRPWEIDLSKIIQEVDHETK